MSKCQRCQGTRIIRKLNTITKTIENKECPDCEGTGYSETEGVFWSVPIVGFVHWVTRKIEDQNVSAALVIISKDEKNKTYSCAIINMNTKKDFRNKGYMSEIITSIQNMFNKKVKTIYTNYNDSTDEGRKFLFNRGFEHKGDFIVWSRQS
jgi:hypothetical protein